MARTGPHSSEAFPAPGRARDQDVGPVESDQPGQPVLAAADRQRRQIRACRDGQGRDQDGQGVTADELQRHRPASWS
jgi:hypothetical protein